MPLLALPDELHLEIVSYLDPYSTLRLSKASTKFFHLLRTPERMTEILLFLETNKPQLFEGRTYMFPCYGCLKVCSASVAFNYSRCSYQCKCCDPDHNDWLYFFGLGRLRCEERRCSTCSAQRAAAFLAAVRQRTREREGNQSGSPSYSPGSEDETMSDNKSESEDETMSDNESESEDEAESTEETESAVATESEDEAEN